MAGDIFTLDADNNAAVRTVPVNAAASETNSPVIFTTDENGNAAVRVVGAGGGSTPVIDELNVTPSTSAQTITAPSGTDGYSPVNVAAVTSAIDANIVAENIKKDVEILGVTGSYEGQIPTGTKSITANGVYDVTDFASAVNQIQYLFNTTTGSQATNGCTVHFPSNFDPSDPDHTFDASTLTGYPTFGGSASYIHLAFDLPATES